MRRAIDILVVLSTCLAARPALAGVPEPTTCEEVLIRGHVTSVTKGRIHVDIGTKHGVEEGMHVAVLPKALAKPHPLYGLPHLCGSDPDVTAVVELDVVGKDASSGEVGRGSSAMKGDLVFVTSSDVTWSRFPGFQSQYRNVWDVSLRFRILIDLDGRGAGFPMDLILGYQTPSPVRIGVYVLPAFLGSRRTTDAVATLGFFASYSTRFFEVGFGLGGYLARPDDVRRLAITQFIRVGAEHGLRVRVLIGYVWDSDEAWGSDEARGLRWDSLRAEFLVPVHPRISIYLDGGGGGGNAGLAFGGFTAGLHVYALGTGGPGTLAIPIGFGLQFAEYSGRCVEDMCGENDFGYFGVVIATGLEARF
jgi:hypothetical protein